MGRTQDGHSPTMSSQKLTDTVVKALPSPAIGNRIPYNFDVKGFGCRVTANGARSFVVNYRTKTGRERRYTTAASPTGQYRQREPKRRSSRSGSTAVMIR